MKLTVPAIALMLSLVAAPSFAASQPGALTAKHFNPDESKKAPAGMSWMACYLTLGWVGSPYGSVTVVGGPYLVQASMEQIMATGETYIQKFAAEYLQERPQEFPKHEFKEKFAKQRGCLSGTHSGDSARIWDLPRRHPNDNLKTDFVPSFAK